MKLEARGLGNRAGDRWLFRALDHAFEPGKLVVVVGRNGAGKTTLLRRLVAGEATGEGEVFLGARPITAWPARERARALAYLPQHTPLYHDLAVWELVSLGRGPHLGRFGWPTAADRAAIEAALDRVDLGSFAARTLSSLSGGERQRCMLARMLAGAAATLVMDEPCTSLDVAHALGFLQLCRELCKSGHTIVIAMHELDLAARHADELLCLGLDDEGAFLVGPPETIVVPDTVRAAFGVELHERGIAFELPRA